MEINTSKLNMQIKLCMLCYHDETWYEHKTKTEYTLWIIQNGNIGIRFGNKEYSLNAGDVILFYPGQTYSAFNIEGDCRFLVLFFSMDMDNSASFLESIHMSGIYREKKLSQEGKKLINAVKKHPSNNTGFNLELYINFLSLFEKMADNRDQAILFGNRFKSRQVSKINKLMEKIESNPENELTVRDMAEFMEMSEKYFISYFHLHTGKTPKQFVVECRMKKAAILLENPDIKIAEIAQTLQYSDMYAFSKAFKKYYNESPASFRKSYYF